MTTAVNEQYNRPKNVAEFTRRSTLIRNFAPCCVLVESDIDSDDDYLPSYLNKSLKSYSPTRTSPVATGKGDEAETDKTNITKRSGSKGAIITMPKEIKESSCQTECSLPEDEAKSENKCKLTNPDQTENKGCITEGDDKHGKEGRGSCEDKGTCTMPCGNPKPERDGLIKEEFSYEDIEDFRNLLNELKTRAECDGCCHKTQESSCESRPTLGFYKTITKLFSNKDQSECDTRATDCRSRGKESHQDEECKWGQSNTLRQIFRANNAKSCESSCINMGAVCTRKHNARGEENCSSSHRCGDSGEFEIKQPCLKGEGLSCDRNKRTSQYEGHEKLCKNHDSKCDLNLSKAKGKSCEKNMGRTNSSPDKKGECKYQSKYENNNGNEKASRASTPSSPGGKAPNEDCGSLCKSPKDNQNSCKQSIGQERNKSPNECDNGTNQPKCRQCDSDDCSSWFQEGKYSCPFCAELAKRNRQEDGFANGCDDKGCEINSKTDDNRSSKGEQPEPRAESKSGTARSQNRYVNGENDCEPKGKMCDRCGQRDCPSLDNEIVCSRVVKTPGDSCRKHNTKASLANHDNDRCQSQSAEIRSCQRTNSASKECKGACPYESEFKNKNSHPNRNNTEFEGSCGKRNRIVEPKDTDERLNTGQGIRKTDIAKLLQRIEKTLEDDE